MSQRKVKKTDGHNLTGGPLTVEEINFGTTNNPELDSTGGSFIWKIKTAAAIAWKLRDDTKGENIIIVNTVDDYIQPLYPIIHYGKVTKAYTDFTAVATSESINLFTLPAGYCIRGRVMKHTTAFNGTSWTACTLEIGITGTTDKYLAASDVFQAVSDTLIFNDDTFYIENWGADTQVLLTANSTGGNLSAGTAGDVEIYYEIQKIPF